MCTALEYSTAELPPYREGQIRVRLKDKNPKVLIEQNGNLRLCGWKGLYPVEKLQKGFLQNSPASRVQIKVNRAQANGVWVHVREGLEGILLKPPNGEPGVYLLTTPSTHYYKTMTGATRMPLLIRQVI